jgi:ABC-type Mn2+/Zn2+ transport system ATPase subunit
LLDEPATGLDQDSAQKLETIVRDIAAQARTAVVMVSHEIGQVKRLADTVVWLDRSVRARGTVDDVIGGRTTFPFSDAAGE